MLTKTLIERCLNKKIFPSNETELEREAKQQSMCCARERKFHKKNTWFFSRLYVLQLTLCLEHDIILENFQVDRRKSFCIMSHPEQFHNSTHCTTFLFCPLLQVQCFSSLWEKSVESSNIALNIRSQLLYIQASIRDENKVNEWRTAFALSGQLLMFLFWTFQHLSLSSLRLCHV